MCYIASIEIESVSVSLVHKATDSLFLCGITSKDICNSLFLSVSLFLLSIRLQTTFFFVVLPAKIFIVSLCFFQSVSVSFVHKTTDHLFLCGITSRDIYSLFLLVSLRFFCA